MATIQFYESEGEGRVFEHGGRYVCDIKRNKEKMSFEDFEEALSELGIPLPEWKETAFGYEAKI